MKRKSSNLGNLLKIGAVLLVAAALYEEMRKPPQEREWHGKLANFIPYDFRMPSVERLRERLWNPDDPRIITEHFFGVGWSINFHSLAERLQLLKAEHDLEEPSDTGEST